MDLWFEAPYFFAVGFPILAWVVAWAWTAPRSEGLGQELGKAAVAGVPPGAVATVLVLCLMDDVSSSVYRALEGLVLIPLPAAIWGSITLCCVLTVLAGRQGRPATPRARRGVTRPVVLGFTIAVILLLVAIVWSQGPYPLSSRL